MSRFIAIDFAGLTQEAWICILNLTDIDALIAIEHEVSIAALCATDEPTREGMGFFYLQMRLQERIEEVREAHRKAEVQEITKRLLASIGSRSTEIRKNLGQGMLSAARAGISDLATLLNDQKNAGLLGEMAQRFYSELVHLEHLVQEADLRLGTQGAKAARGVHSQFEANLKTGNVNAAQTNLTRLRTDSKLFAGLAIHLGSSQAREEFFKKAPKRISEVREQRAKKTRVSKEKELVPA